MKITLLIAMRIPIPCDDENENGRFWAISE
jgi:hypothetical protein